MSTQNSGLPLACVCEEKQKEQRTTNNNLALCPRGKEACWNDIRGYSKGDSIWGFLSCTFQPGQKRVWSRRVASIMPSTHPQIANWTKPSKIYVWVQRFPRSTHFLRPGPICDLRVIWWHYAGDTSIFTPIFSSHKFNGQHFKCRVSNPRTIAYAHFKMPFESSSLPGAGHIFPDWTFENWLHGPRTPTSEMFDVLCFEWTHIWVKHVFEINYFWGNTTWLTFWVNKWSEFEWTNVWVYLLSEQNMIDLLSEQMVWQ